MSEDELVDVRRRTVAFVFQAFGLVPFLTATENVEVPLRLVHADPRERDAASPTLLDVVGLGGSREAPAARAVGRRAAARRPRPGPREPAQPPPRRRADRPARLRHGARDHAAAPVDRPAEGITAVVATHDPMMLDVADRVLELRDGAFVAAG